MPLPPRIKSLDKLDGSASHCVSLPTEITHCSLYSSTVTILTKTGISFFPFCLRVKYWKWEGETNGEAGSGMQIWWGIWGHKKDKARRKQMLHSNERATDIYSLMFYRLYISSCHTPRVSFMKTQVKGHQLINTDNTHTPTWAEYARILYTTSLWYCSSTGT